MRAALALTLTLVLAGGCQTLPAPDDTDSSGPRATKPPEAPDASKSTTVERPGATDAESPQAVPSGEDLWDAIRAEFRLDHEIDHPKVRTEIDALRRYPTHLLKVRERLELYLPQVFEQVRSRGLPGELALLPIIESSMNPHAEVLNGPAGLWQFIPATADRMDLPRSWWYDGRRDPASSTRAALDYLEYLYGRFDDWQLAIVSYNTGEGTVTRALGGRTGPVSFWSLRLPAAGMVFVPKLLALAEIVAHPERYGITLPELRTGPTFATLETGGQVEIAKAAEALGLDEETLYLLNPALNRSATPPDGPHELHVPPGLAVRARTWLAGLDRNERVEWDRIEVRRGDSLSVLAIRHGTDIRTLRQINNLSDDRLRAGQYLFVPGPSAGRRPTAAASKVAATSPVSAAPGTGAAGSDQAGAHIVRSGDTLWDIARTYRVSMDRLIAANRLRPGQVLKIGQRLVIPGAAASG